MTHVLARPLAPESPLHARMNAGDFLDCFSVAARTTPREAAAIITTFPRWVQSLMTLRNTLVAPFGLLTDGPETGDKIGPFPVTQETEQEVIAGFDDRHLDFRVSVRAHNGEVSLATWVRPHNIGGRAYLTVILPFHVLIARNALRRVAAFTTV